MLRKYFAFMFVTICVTSCFHTNILEAMRISKYFSKEHTGLDTLIRINGYYYREDSTGLHLPFFFFKNREFRIFSLGKLKTHEEVQMVINSFEARSGNYLLSKDTINTIWVIPYALGGYIVYSDKFLIINDSTLKHIWHYHSFNGKHELEKKDIYNFYEYKYDLK
jgi:hypothetical protein